MNARQARTRAYPPRAGLVALALVSATGLGVLTVALLGRSDSVEVATPEVVSEAAAQQPAPAGAVAGPGAGATTAPDPGVGWIELGASPVAPIVADGAVAWIASAERVSDDGPFESVLLQFRAGDLSLTRIAVFGGSPTALAVGETFVAIGAGNSVIVVDKAAGTIRAVELEAPANGEVDASFVTALAIENGLIFVARANSTTVHVVDSASMTVISEHSVEGKMAPPTRLIAMQGGIILASTPFGEVGGSGPGSVVIDHLRGTTTAVDLGRPFTFARAPGGAVVATQAVPAGGLTGHAVDAAGGLSSERRVGGSRIPWDGRWDLLALGPDGSVWGSTAGADSIFQERPDGSVSAFLLPTRKIIPSLPGGTKLTPEDEARFVIVRRPESMAVLADGTLVFLVANGGGALGYIAPAP